MLLVAAAAAADDDDDDDDELAGCSWGWETSKSPV